MLLGATHVLYRGPTASRMQLQQGVALEMGLSSGRYRVVLQRLDAPEPLYGVGSLTEYGFTAGARDNAGTLGLEQQCGVGTCHQHPNERGLVLTCLGLPCSVTQSQFPLRVRARK
jgi:hypothetical protein